MLTTDEIEMYVKAIERERDDEAEKKKQKKDATSAGGAY